MPPQRGPDRTPNLLSPLIYFHSGSTFNDRPVLLCAVLLFMCLVALARYVDEMRRLLASSRHRTSQGRGGKSTHTGRPHDPFPWKPRGRTPLMRAGSQEISGRTWIAVFSGKSPEPVGATGMSSCPQAPRAYGCFQRGAHVCRIDNFCPRSRRTVCCWNSLRRTRLVGRDR